MKSVVTQIIATNLNDYKIVLVPHEELRNRIMEIRKSFADQYKAEHPILSVPEITLVTFKQLPAAETRIINRLKIVAMGRPQIKVELKDFGSYPSHSVFINVTSKVPLTELSKKIRQEAQRLMKISPEHTPHFMTDFSVTVGRRLQPWQYEQAWLEYSNRHFTGKFVASSIILMKRKQGEFRYKPIGSFDLQNLAIETKQGELF